MVSARPLCSSVARVWGGLIHPSQDVPADEARRREIALDERRLRRRPAADPTTQGEKLSRALAVTLVGARHRPRHRQQGIPRVAVRIAKSITGWPVHPSWIRDRKHHARDAIESVPERRSSRHERCDVPPFIGRAIVSARAGAAGKPVPRRR